MEEERSKILTMLEQGVITAGEAAELLDAVSASPADPPGEGASAGVPQAVGEAVRIHRPHADDPTTPDLERFRSFWRYPFYAAVGLLVISGLALTLFNSTAQGRFTLGVFCAGSFLVIAAVAVVLAYASRTARWLHVRIQEADGDRIAISLPAPLGLANWGIQIARRFVDNETAANLDTAQTMIAALQHEMDQPGSQPIIVDVDDDDGDRVKVYIL
jgi:hypothetical protein